MADKAQPIRCGVDVAMDTLDIAQAGHAVIHIANTAESITTWLSSLPGLASIAMEATGHYHELLMEHALNAGHTVYLINAKQLHHYREAVGQRAKTDPEDARLILRFLVREENELAPVKLLDSREKRLWRLLQRRAKLVRVKTLLRLSLESEPETLTLASDVTGKFDEAIAQVEHLMRALARELGWGEAIKRCQSIPGIGPLNALALVSCFHRGDFSHADKWVAYMGLDVRVRDSGKFKGRRKLTKRGNPEMRRLLFNAAMSAVRGAHFRPCYEHYRARGLSTTAALVAIARKLVRIAYALLTKEQYFDAKAC